MKLVSFGVTAKIVVVVQDQDAGIVAVRFPIEMRRGQAANDTSDLDRFQAQPKWVMSDEED